MQTVPTPENRGLLEAGTMIDTPNGRGVILRQSDTAYEVATGPFSFWMSFDRVHGKPAPVTPLVTFGEW